MKNVFAFLTLSFAISPSITQASWEETLVVHLGDTKHSGHVVEKICDRPHPDGRSQTYNAEVIVDCRQQHQQIQQQQREITEYHSHDFFELTQMTENSVRTFLTTTGATLVITCIR